MRRFILIPFLLFTLAGTAWAQDDCATAVDIPFGANDFATGVFTTADYDLTAATTQAGEHFHSTQVTAGTDKKSIWFKFTLPTARAVDLELRQPGTAIPQDAVGFTVYKSGSCLPGAADIGPAKLTPLSKFGSSFNPCLNPGEYLVQVSAKAGANDVISLALDVQTPGILDVYDFATTAQSIGTLSGNSTYTYDVGCQTIDDPTEVCTGLPDAAEYTQSTWHTFTTDGWVDALRIAFGQQTWDSLPHVYGFELFEGTPTGTLTPVITCTALEQTNENLPDIDLDCQLDPNTDYTFKFYYKKDETFTARMNLYEVGSGPNTGADPLSLGPANDFGLLTATTGGNTDTRDDYFACASKLSTATAPCDTTFTPPGGVDGYELNTWFRFEADGSSNIRIGANTQCARPKIRLFQGTLTAACANADLNLYDEFTSPRTFNCLTAGTYYVQVLGQNNDFSVCNNSSSNLGRPVQLQIEATAVNPSNTYDLSAPTAFEDVNGGAALPAGVTLPLNSDQFGCNNTLLPDDNTCGPASRPNEKAIYRRIVIGSNGILRVSNGNWRYLRYKLYRGDAPALAGAQGVSSAGEVITGLEDQFGCKSLNAAVRVCVTPGVYTLVTFGDSTDVGRSDAPSVRFTTPTTQYNNPAAPNNLGTITGNTTAPSDVFTCVDNPLTIDGKTPCNGATKQIYREFYLDAPTLMSFGSSDYNTIRWSLFQGRISDGVGTLSIHSDPQRGDWHCRPDGYSTHPCEPLPAGWYTVVQYGFGEDFISPAYTSGSGADIGQSVNFRLSPTSPPNTPQYNRPNIACEANGGSPLTITNSGSAAVPQTTTSYTLCREYFNCTDDLPFSAHPITGCSGYNRTAYYTFELGQESYVRIQNVARTHRIQVYAGDARTNPAILGSAPLQPCVQQQTYPAFGPQNYTELCNIQAGTYTIVIFADDSHIGNSVQPQLVLEEPGYSRFDHAESAYDFGVVPPNGQTYFGAVDDPFAATPIEDAHPTVPGRVASSDIFYCTTGAQPNDPTDATSEGAGGDGTKCEIGDYDDPALSSVPYPMPNNYAPYADNTTAAPLPRRTLWYTFVIEGAGRVSVDVNDRTPGKTKQPRFSVYRSDVDGNLDFSTVVSSGAVDSTVAQGLTFIDNSRRFQVFSDFYYCRHQNTVQFELDPCSVTGRTRYYVIVDNYYGEYPNAQVDMSVRHEFFPNPEVKHDFCAGAADPEENAYDFGTVGTGTYNSDTSSFACVTASPDDPNACGEKTIWYTFDSEIAGRFRVNYEIFPDSLRTFGDSDIEVYRADCGNFDASNRVPLTSVTSGGELWGEGCLAPGRYYFLMTGCNYSIEDVVTHLELIPEQGDMCSAPDPAAGALGVTLSPAVGATASATGTLAVDCHSVGESFGEDGSNMGCLFGPANYKTSWFRFDITTLEKVDLSFQLTESTTALPSEIRYRVLYGSCDAMNAGPCNSDALTEFTLNCMTTGTYYIQVAVPDYATGDISLTASTSPSPDQTCVPLDPTQPIANFTIGAACVGEPIQFNNFSTQGSFISYDWAFGDPGASTSTDFSPTFTYATPGTYTVTLTATNTDNGKSDVVSIPVTVYDIPDANITFSPGPTSAGTCPTIVANSPYDWSAGSTIGDSWAWTFDDAAVSSLENPTGIIIPDEGSQLIELEVANGTCVREFDTCVVTGLEPIFDGGPYDGAHREQSSDCPDEIVYNGGPYDGADRGQSADCPDEIVYNGGPYDGADRGQAADCPDEIVYNGGPYDGAARGQSADCPDEIVYNGGPFDGADRATSLIELTSTGVTNNQVCIGETIDLEVNLTIGTVISTTWAPGGQTTSSISVSPTSATTYTGTIIFEWPSGCQDTIAQSFPVNVVDGPLALVGNDTSFCTSGTATLGAPPQANVTYAWTPTTGLSDPTASNPTASVSSDETYTLTVTDTTITGGCATANASVDITIVSPPSVTPGPDQIVCPGGTENITATPSAGATLVYFEIDSAGNYTDTLGTNASYSVDTGYYAVAADNGVCLGDTAHIRVTERDEISLDYRSRQNGDWSALTTWQVLDPTSGNWVNAESFGVCGPVPYPTSRSLTVLVSHDVTYDLIYDNTAAISTANNPYGIDETTIDPAGTLIVPLGQELALVDSSNSYDLRNNGRFEIEGTFTPVGNGLLENSDPSFVAYTRMGNQTMWDGTYGNLEATGGGVKVVGGSSSVVRTDVHFLGAHIQLGNNPMTLWDNAGTLGEGLTSGFFITDAFGQVTKRAVDAVGFFYPVGHALASYNPFMLMNNGTIDNYALRVGGAFEYDAAVAGDELDAITSVDRTWHLDEDIAGGSDLSITPYWETPHQNPAFDPTNCANGRYAAGPGWTRLGTLAAANGAGTVADPHRRTYTGLTETGPISVGSCDLAPIDYRTIADGDWTDVSIWEVWDQTSSTWKPASFVNASCSNVQYPTALSRYVDVRHTVELDQTINMGVDQLVIRNTGEVFVPTGVTLKIAEGSLTGDVVSTSLPPAAAAPVAGTDILNLGTIEVEGAIEIIGSGTLFNDDNSLVHYSGDDQQMWAGKYGSLWIDGQQANAGSKKTVSGPGTRVNTALRFINGKIELQDDNLTLAGDANLITPGQNSGYVIATANGYVVWEYPSGSGISRSFPIGGDEYSPAEIVFDNISSAGTLLGRVREFKHPQLAEGIERFWTIDSGTIVYSGNYTGEFNYQDIDLPSVPANATQELEMVKIGGVYNPVYTQPNSWRLSPTHIAVNHDLNNNLGYITNDAFSDFTFMPFYEEPLDVEGLALSGRWQGKDAELKWSVLTEKNTYGYELERSLNTRQWAPVAFRNATGTSTEPQFYAHLDTEVADLNTEMFYYRVRAIDYDGSVQTSNIVNLRAQTASGLSLMIYPNPVSQSGELNLAFVLAEAGTVSVMIYDMVGKRLTNARHELDAGAQSLVLSTRDLAEGVYLLKIQTPSATLTRRVVVSK